MLLTSVAVLLLVHLFLHAANAQNSALYEQGLDDCFGTNSICNAKNDMTQCNDFNHDEQFRCECESGYLAADQACTDCKYTYSMDEDDIGNMLSVLSESSSSCEDMGYTVGPIPQSVLDQVSLHNATHTASSYPDGTATPGEALSSDTPDYVHFTMNGGSAALSLPTMVDTASIFGPTADAAAGRERSTGKAMAALCGLGIYWMAN